MKKLSWIILGFILAVGCVSIYNPATGKKEIYFISEASEINLGQNMARDILKQEPVVKDKKMNEYLDRVGEKIAKVSHRNNLNYQFSILDEEELNAFAVPGGFIFVNKGLIERLSEAELAFVLAHEVGHISARHSLKRLQSSLGLSLLIGLALQDPDYQSLNQAIKVVYNVVALGYSRKDELLADSLGVKYLDQAGYNPGAAVSLIKTLAKEGKRNNFVFLSSHPSLPQRLENIEKELKASSDKP